MEKLEAIKKDVLGDIAHEEECIKNVIKILSEGKNLPTSTFISLAERKMKIDTLRQVLDMLDY